MSRRKTPKAIVIIFVLAVLLISVGRTLRDRPKAPSDNITPTHRDILPDSATPTSPSPTTPTSAPRSTEAAPSEKTFSARVLYVKDGDSVVIFYEGKKQTLRLFGIDCPEHFQPFGDEARQFVSTLLRKKEISITVKDRDHYKRLVVIIEYDGQCVNETLVRKGLAWAYRRYSKRFIAAEKEARAAKHGLWKQSNPLPPWEFRRKNR